MVRSTETTLQLAESLRAKSKYFKKINGTLVNIGLGFSICSLIIQDIQNNFGFVKYELDWISGFLAILFQVIAHYYAQKTRHIHSYAREANRWNFLCDSLIFNEIDNNEIRASMLLFCTEQSIKYQETNTENRKYYQSGKEKGFHRLLENLMESTFYTNNIVSKTLLRSKIYLFVIISISAVTLLIFFNMDNTKIDHLLLTTVLISIIAPVVQKFIDAERMHNSSKRLNILETKISGLLKNKYISNDKLPLIIQYISSYYSITSELDPLDSSTFIKYRERYEQIYSEITKNS